MPEPYTGGNVASAELQYSKGLLLFDDCEGTLRWSEGGTGGDTVLAYATVASCFGTNGLHIKTRTTTATDGDTIQLYRYLHTPYSGRAFYRLRFRIPTLATVEKIEFWTEQWKDGQKYRAEFTFWPNTGVFGRQDDGGSDQAITALACVPLPLQWQALQFAIDWKALEYISASLNGVSASLAGLGLNNVTTSTATMLSFGMNVEAAGAAAAEIYADAFYIGEDENR